MSDTTIEQSLIITKGFRSTNLSSSRLVKTGTGTIRRILVNSHTSGSFRIYDGTAFASATAVGGTYTPASGSSTIEVEAAFGTGLFVQVGGTIDTTVIYE